jgi:hypothetical protein
MPGDHPVHLERFVPAACVGVALVLALAVGVVAAVNRWRLDGGPPGEGDLVRGPGPPISLCTYIGRHLGRVDGVTSPAAVLRDPLWAPSILPSGGRDPSLSAMVYLGAIDVALPFEIVDIPRQVAGHYTIFYLDLKRRTATGQPTPPPSPTALAAATSVQTYLVQCPSRTSPDHARSRGP